ncbi:hypothetical protein GCM10011345_17180 [Gemmobacter megaterium]|nr:hypothetical protein GCM10011345_17180 [Gemmobacter megaterium]
MASFSRPGAAAALRACLRPAAHAARAWVAAPDPRPDGVRQRTARGAGGDLQTGPRAGILPMHNRGRA